VALAAGGVLEISNDPTPHVISTDTLRSIEMVTGSDYNDVFDATNFGTTGSNVGSKVTSNADGLFNEFEGRGGDDFIVGNGQTRISYYHATSGVTVTFTPNSWTSNFTNSGAAGTQTGDASVGNDHFSGVNSVRGSFFNYTLTGSTNPFGTGENFEGLGGGDAIDGGGGFDRAVYSREEAGLVFNMAAGTVLLASDSSNTGDTLRSIEAIWGTELADTYDATNFSPSSANAGSAQFSAGNSASTNFNEFEGGGGNDTVIGNGNTRVVFYHATAGVVVTLGPSGSGNADGDASVGHDTFTGSAAGGVTRVRGSEFNDIITGNGSGNTLEGQGGNDVLDGRGGSDVLTGGNGSDIFVYDGVGNDRISDFNRADADRIDLRAFSSVHSMNDFVVSTGPVNGVANSTIITFAGATLGLQGYDSAAHPLQASDFVFAGQVAVTVQTPEGYDFGTLYDDLANSSFLNLPDRIYAIDAGKGISFELIGTGITVDPVTHHWNGGTITEINVLDTIDPVNAAQRTQDHVLVNTNGWNVSASALYDGIHGYASGVPASHDAGLTALNGIFNAATYSIVGGGDGIYPNTTNVLFGGDHADTFKGTSIPFGSNTVDYSHAAAPVAVNLLNGATGGAAAGDVFLSIDSLRGSDFNDTLTGDAGWNRLEGGLGNDTLDGGAGINVVSYEHATPGIGNLGVTVDLGIIGQQDTVGAGLDTLSNFQIVIGSAGHDTLTGDGNDNLLLGGAGADALHGGGGTDGVDYEFASTGVTVSLAQPGLNTGDAAGDTFDSIENLSGSQFNDVLIGDSGNNQLWGFNGNDTFVFNVTEDIGHDVVNDFRPGQDHIQLDYLAFTPGDTGSFDDWLLAHSTPAPGNANSLLIDFDLNGQNTVVLQNVSRAALHMNDFILAPGHA
jgi:Ca2+-binding RTX toxin-like protein